MSDCLNLPSVREDPVVSVHSDLGYDGNPCLWPGIDSLFLVLQLKVEADSLVVLNASIIDFDSDFGFARNAFFDFSESKCDGYSVSVQNPTALYCPISSVAPMDSTLKINSFRDCSILLEMLPLRCP